MASTNELMTNSSPSLFDERVQIPSRGVLLAARFTRVSPSAPVLILAHGFAGDKDEKGLFIAARDFFAGNGFSVLRFDFRGCGESEGDFRAVRLKDLADDLVCVSRYVRLNLDVKASAIGLVCFSLAAGVAVLANSVQIGALAFWSPAVYTDRDMAPRYRTAEIKSEIARRGWFEKAGLQVGEGFLNDLAGKQIEESLQEIRRPVLVIHGTEDQRIPVSSSEELIRHLPRKSDLTVIPGANHSFRSQPMHREWLFSATTAWFAKRLHKPSRLSGSQTELFDADREVATS